MKRAERPIEAVVYLRQHEEIIRYNAVLLDLADLTEDQDEYRRLKVVLLTHGPAHEVKTATDS